ncbi:MAG: hypothetical protein M3O02_03480 [Acidobacteriota bacterium]|nr:hypothetical protein [Acidobacteriota bacterium]
MKLRLLLAAAVLLPAVSAVRAQTASAPADSPSGNSAGNQFGIYLNPIAIRISNSVKDTSSFSFLGTSDTSRVFWGVDYGMYYDFLHTGAITVGADLRAANLHANNASLKDLLVGVRVSGQVGQSAWHPYAEAMIGGGWTKAPASAISVRKVQYQGFVGVDRPIGKHVDLRAIEAGYGSLHTISSATVGNGGNVSIPASSLLSISSGLVFRF